MDDGHICPLGDTDTVACLRCGQAVCASHHPDVDERCASCETSYRDAQPRVGWRTLRAAPVALAGAFGGGLVGIVGFAMGPTLGAISIYLGIGAGAYTFGKAFDRHLESRRRKLFLREPTLPEARLLSDVSV